MKNGMYAPSGDLSIFRRAVNGRRIGLLQRNSSARSIFIPDSSRKLQIPKPYILKVSPTFPVVISGGRRGRSNLGGFYLRIAAARARL
jgi:hypothetical protein